MLSDDEIKDMMTFVLNFYKASKRADFKKMNAFGLKAARYLKEIDKTPDDFKVTVEATGGKMPPKESFFNTVIHFYVQL